MVKKRAVYIGDVKFMSCPVFELTDSGWYEMLEYDEFRYEKSAVENDTNWLIFEVDAEEDKIKLISRL